MGLPTPAERRVLYLQRAALILFGPSGSIRYLHTYQASLGAPPAAAAWAGGEPARRVGESLREIGVRGGTWWETSSADDG